MIRRHLDVGDDHVRAVRPGLPGQVLRVGRGSDHVEAVVLQHVHDALPDEGLVVAHDHADLPWRTHSTTPTLPADSLESGIRACSMVPPSAG
jgi:hypothetical protein